MGAPTAIGLGVLLAACGRDDAGGTLICKDRGRTYTIAVAPGTLGQARAHAEAADFSDCEFESGTVARREPPKRELRIPERDIMIPDPPPPPPIDPDDGVVVGGILSTPPQNIPPTLFEAQRTGGDKNILPDDATKLEIQQSGKERVVGSYKLCVTETGAVTTVNQLKSTGFAGYDGKLMREMRAWTFRPYLVNGVERSVCTAYTFIYSAK
jgi:hypothetical protein